MPASLPAGPGDLRNALHLCVDMQRLFAEETDWHTPTLDAILPNVLRIAEAMPDRTLFARFTVPDRAEDAVGSWQAYYRRWPRLTGAAMDVALLDLVAPLAALAGPDRILDKPTYSLFSNPRLEETLRGRGADTLILTGVETDVCVLATLFGAIDLGYRCLLVRDAVTSSSLPAHRAVLDHLLPRLPQQVETIETAELLTALTAGRIEAR